MLQLILPIGIIMAQPDNIPGKKIPEQVVDFNKLVVDDKC